MRSRRLGRSLGVNLLPAGVKVCNMNCAYCQYGFTQGAPRRRDRSQAWPAAATVEAAVEARLTQAADSNEWLDRLTVAGHGEPTLHPDFEEIAGRLRSVRDRISPAIQLAVLSNSTTAGRPGVRRGLAFFDERYMKLDAGDPITCARVNGLRMPIADIVDALRALEAIVVQAMFVTDPSGEVDNTTEGAVSEWLAAIERVKPTRVHIYTLDRPPAMSGLKAAPARRLREIAEHVRSAGIPADVFSSRAGR